MSSFCKIFFTIIGFYLTKYFEFSFSPFAGGFLGFVLGFAFDEGINVQIAKRRYKRAMANQRNLEANNAIFYDAIPMIAKVATVDGEINKLESEMIEKIFSEVLRLKRKPKKLAYSILNQARFSSATFYAHAAHYSSAFYNEPEMRSRLIEILFLVATSDDKLNEKEEKLIRSGAQLIGITQPEYEELFDKFALREKNAGTSQKKSTNSGTSNKTESTTASDSDSFYQVLGCSRDANLEDIKRNYRKLVAEFHPDKIAGKELPQAFVEFANEKFRSIQEAYDGIKKERGVA